jgi:integrase
LGCELGISVENIVYLFARIFFIEYELTHKCARQYLAVFDLREKLISRLAIFEGLRPGEIFALRWKSLEGEIIRVEQRIYKRVLNTPKNGKTREGAISDGTLTLIKQWADLAEDPSPDGFVFPSEKLTTPLSLGQSLEAVHATEAGKSWAGMGDVSASGARRRISTDKHGHPHGRVVGNAHDRHLAAIQSHASTRLASGNRPFTLPQTLQLPRPDQHPDSTQRLLAIPRAKTNRGVFP